MIVDECGALENSTDVTNIIFDELIIHMENTGGDTSWINRNNERHNIRIQNMVRAGLIENN